MSTYSRTRKQKKDDVTANVLNQTNRDHRHYKVNSSDTFSDDSLLDGEYTRRHNCLAKLPTYRSKTFAEKNNNIQNNHSKKTLQRATSCSYCSLCECNESNFNEDDQIFPIRKAASCSICDWDFEESEGLEKISSETEEESPSSGNNFSLNSTPRKSRISRSMSSMNYSSVYDSEQEIPFETKFDSEFERDFKGGFERDFQSSSTNNDITSGDENETEANIFQSTPVKRRNSYSEAVDNEMESPIDLIGKVYQRSPPDGGESYSETLKADFNYNHVTLNKEKEQIKKYNEKENNNTNENSRKIIKKIRFKNSKKKKTKSAATEEFDEIFGRVSITPQSSFEQFDQPDIYISSEDCNDSTQCSFDSDNNNEQIDSTTEEPFFQARKHQNKRTSLALSHLLPTNSLLRHKRKSNLNVNKSKSVEVLYTNEFSSPFSEGYMNKALSTLDISSGTLYYGDIIDSDSQINEKWSNYLKRIDGITILGGNPAIRYIWHQIGSNQSDLLQSFEDFLKNMVAQLQEAYTKCQDLETLISDKKEKQVKETARLYDDVEQALNDERQEMQEKQAEKYEQLRLEFQKIIDDKEKEYEEMSKRNKDFSNLIDNLRSENEELTQKDSENEEKILHLVDSESGLRKENDKLTQEISELKNQLQLMEEKICTLEDHIVQMNTISQVEKEKHQKFLLQYEDLSEEKSFLEVNLKNVTAELSDLKNNSSLFGEQMSFNDTNNAMVSSPILNRINSVSDTDEFEYDETDTSCQFNSTNQKLLIENNITPIKQQLFSPRNTSENVKMKPPLYNNEKKDIPRKIPSIFSLSPTHQVPPKRINRSVNASPIRLASQNQSEYKVIFVGDINVGKTSLIRRIHSGKFRASREPTICTDFYTKEIQYNGQVAPLKLWDTLGQERFRSIPPSYFRRADVVILMYDIEEEETFLNARQWIKKIHEHTDESVVLILVANKTDMHHRRSVAIERGEKLARDHDAMFIETSAKNGENVAKLCQMLASTLLDREDTLIIRKDFDTSLCSLSYSQRQNMQPPCC